MKSVQRGATIIEFSLVLLVFLMFLLGILDFARMLYTWNAATEATRAGARYAAVCDDGAHPDLVLARMQQLLPQITAVDVQWSPASCTASTCEWVTVSIRDLNFQWISPIPGAVSMAIPMPPFSTTLPREVMRQDSHSNALCS